MGASRAGAVRAGLGTVLAVALAAGPAGCGADARTAVTEAPAAASDPPPRPLPPIPATEQGVGGSGESRLPNQTARNWVTYADHVVAVTVVAERENLPDAEDLLVGEGLIGRDVTLRVDDVLWSSRTAAQPVPEQVEWTAWGWVFSDFRPDLRRPMADADTPRLELGHHYLVALQWEDARCSEGEPMTPAQWLTLGSDSIVPYDDGIIGQGEMGGGRQDAATARANLAGRPYPSLRDTLLTRTADDLAAALTAARPGRRGHYGGPPAPCPSPDPSGESVLSDAFPRTHSY